MLGILPRLTSNKMLVRDLKVMDASAIALSRENQIPIVVFSLAGRDSVAQAAQGKGKFTVIRDKK